jgi:hypothetical protein
MSTTTQLKQLQAEIALLQNVRNSTEYVALEAEIQQLQGRLRQAKQNYQASVADEIAAKESDIKALKMQQLRETNPAFQYSIPLLSWFNRWGRGIDWGQGGVRLRWVSPNQNWVIITAGGGTAGQGTPMGTGAYYYAAATHYLYRVVDGATHMNSTSKYQFSFEGRLLKATKEEWIAFALIQDEGCPFTENLDRSTHGGYRVGDYVFNEMRRTYGFIWELNNYQHKPTVSFRDDPYYNRPIGYPLERVETVLRLAKRVEEMDYQGMFDLVSPDDNPANQALREVPPTSPLPDKSLEGFLL